MKEINENKNVIKNGGLLERLGEDEGDKRIKMG